MASILVVDDDPEVRCLCRMVLTGEGHVVLEAADGTACIALARASHPNLVLLDWMMPGLDGIEALRMLKASSRTARIPVVMLTARDSLSNVALATYAGADGYVTKPFEPKDLVAIVRRYVGEASPSSPDGG